MKKILLFFIPFLLLIGVRVKAESSSYYVQFESDECRMPIGGVVTEYLPKAYVYSSVTNEMVSDDVVYTFGFYGNNLSNVKTKNVGTYPLFVNAESNLYPGVNKTQYVKVSVYDDVAPKVEIDSVINRSYDNDFDLYKHIRATDNSLDELSYAIIGDYKINKVGTYDLIARVTDKSGNSSDQSFTLNIYDNKAPIINTPDVIDIEYENEIDINDYVKVIDEHDGKIDFNITDFNSNTLGANNCIISAVDSSGNQSVKEIIINIIDSTSPIITLKKNELVENEGYELKKNILSVTDNHDQLNLDNVNVVTKKIGTGKYEVTYVVNDSNYNQGIASCIINYKYNNIPVIEAINLDNLTDPFDPLNYVKAYDAEDGDLTSKIMVVEVDYLNKFGIYEVYDSDGNVTKIRVNYVTKEIIDEYENNQTNNIVFPKVEENNEDIIPEVNKETQNKVKEHDYTIIYYIIAGVIVLGFIVVILFKHFKKKMV